MQLEKFNDNLSNRSKNVQFKKIYFIRNIVDLL